MTRSIMLGRDGRYEALVSDEDYLFLTQWKWQWKLSSRKYANGGDKGIYAKRTTTIQGRKVTLLMSHVILERMGKPRPPDHDADHQNDRSLDNQRHNLDWVHQTLNRRCAKKHYAGAERYAEAA